MKWAHQDPMAKNQFYLTSTSDHTSYKYESTDFLYLQKIVSRVEKSIPLFK
ncbi:MAG: hypothetical protein ACLGGX_11780 [Bdellovibrionia bacterium]